LKLLVLEYTAGGGYVGAAIPSSVLSEGYGMLRALISDLKAAGHEVTTFLDFRLARFDPPIRANAIHVSGPGQLEGALISLSRSVDAVYLIAPESDGTLGRLVEIVKRSGGLSLNCSACAIAMASDKSKMYTALGQSRLPIPQYITINPGRIKQKIHDAIAQLGLPVIFKPTHGAGCGGLSLVTKRAEVPLAVDRARASSSSFIVQKFMTGIAASVSVICAGERATPLSLNRQLLRLVSPESESGYLGGLVPLRHPMEHEALSIGRRAVESIEGLRGYVGVDMVLTSHGPVIIEVNPRLTTSYIGIGCVLNLNLAQALVEAVIQHKLPRRPRTSGYAIFSKVVTPPFPSENLFRTYGMPEVISPPFPTDEGKAYALIGAKSVTPMRSRRLLSNARRRLIQTLRKGSMW
jgi:predicted ATP-grasp superfamily ATP-dependent carboligase